jgi:hypothetical protein
MADASQIAPARSDVARRVRSGPFKRDAAWQGIDYGQQMQSKARSCRKMRLTQGFTQMIPYPIAYTA